MDLSGWSPARLPDLRGRTVLVTGANSGIGLEAAMALAARAATVLLACRNPDRAAEAVRRCQERATGPRPRAVSLDLSDLASVRSCADELAAEVEQLDILINNAGVMALPRLLTVDGFETQLATNHLGHFALTGLLLPLLRRSSEARVVTVSSLLAARAHTLPLDDLQGEVAYDSWAAYHRSKLANLLFAFELDRRSAARGWRLRSVAAHPGLSSTRLLANGRSAWAPSASGLAVGLAIRLIGQPSRRGAFPLLRAATAPATPAVPDPAIHGAYGRSTHGTAVYYGPRGPGHLRGRPTTARPPRPALDRDLAARLWTISEELTGVAFPTGA